MVNPESKRSGRAQKLPTTSTEASTPVEGSLPPVLAALKADPRDELTELEVFRLYRDTQAKELREELRNYLIARYVPRVVQIAGRVASKLPKSVELDDLISNGTFGLIDAIDGFDPERGLKFTTYASARIRGSMLDQLRSEDWVPRLERFREAKYEREDEEFFRETGGHLPGRPQILTAFYLEGLRQAVNPEDLTWADTIAATGTDADPTFGALFEDLFAYLSRGLSEKERDVILHHLVTGIPLRLIGEFHGVTESRACQIESAIIIRLRTQFPELVHVEQKKEREPSKNKLRLVRDKGSADIIAITLSDSIESGEDLKVTSKIPSRSTSRSTPRSNGAAAQNDSVTELEDDSDDSLPFDGANLKLID